MRTLTLYLRGKIEYMTPTHVHPHFGLRALGMDVIPSIPCSP